MFACSVGFLFGIFFSIRFLMLFQKKILCLYHTSWRSFHLISCFQTWPIVVVKFLKFDFAALISWIFWILCFTPWTNFRKLNISRTSINENQRLKSVVQCRNQEITKSVIFGIFYPRLLFYPLLTYFWHKITYCWKISTSKC